MQNPSSRVYCYFSIFQAPEHPSTQNTRHQNLPSVPYILKTAVNLTVQEILKQIKAGETQSEDEILKNINTEEITTTAVTNIVIGEVIPKVSLIYTLFFKS